MGSLEFEERLKVNAYRLFHAELHKHLETARADLSGTAEPSREQLKKLGGIFHLLRGGAGFFGLDSLAKISQRLEEILLHDASRSAARLQEARQLVEEIERVAADIPEPSNPSS